MALPRKSVRRGIAPVDFAGREYNSVVIGDRTYPCQSGGSLMVAKIRSAIDFYQRPSISVEIIQTKLCASRGHLSHIAPDELFPHDQDHYGGLDAATP